MSFYNILHDLIIYTTSFNDLWLFKHISDNYVFIYSTDYSLIITLKISFCLAFLIVIRGCIPRYRYDFLTKMGWVKFLGYVLTIFLITIIFFLIW